MIGTVLTEPIHGEVARTAWADGMLARLPAAPFPETPPARITAAALADLLGYWSASDGPLYRLLATRLGRLADTAELPTGLRLPPERELATVLSVSRNTVAMAYQVLRDEGMADSRQGSGTRIVPHQCTPAGVHRANGFFTRILGTSPVEADLTLATVECAPQVAAALEDPSSVLSAAARRAITATPGYFPYGLPDLRAAIAGMLTTRHDLPTRPEEVIVTTGAQQALDLLIRCEVVAGQPVVTEDPTFPGVLDALHRSGARPVGVPVGDMTRLERALAAHRPPLVYLVPTHQNPVGVSLPLTARRGVLALAKAYPDTVFIDDMTVADLPLTDDPALPLLAALDSCTPNVVTVGSLSKTYWGGLRTGWIRAPQGIIARLASAKAAADLGSTAYQQAIVAALIAGRNDEILKWRADWLRPRCAAITAALRQYLPAWQWACPEGGLSIWARLPGNADAGAFTQAALRKCVAVVPGRLLSATGDADARRHVRLAFVLPPDQLTAAIKTLSAIDLPP